MSGPADYGVDGKKPELIRVDLAKSMGASSVVAEMAKSMGASSVVADAVKSMGASSIYSDAFASLGNIQIDGIIEKSAELDPSGDYSRRLLEMPGVAARIAESLELATSPDSKPMESSSSVVDGVGEHSGGLTQDDRIMLVVFVVTLLLSVEVWLFLTNRELFDLVNSSSGGLSLLLAGIGRRD